MVEFQQGDRAMTIAGTVQNGVVILEGGPPLPDGTRVEVVVPKPKPTPPPAEPGEPTLRSLLKFAGVIKGMPADFAAQHDHYIHGTPKR
jgi:hypothetical protein